jgi:hypothetical protein
MEDKRRSQTTNEEIEKAAAECSSRSEFSVRFGRLYQLAKHRGIFDDLAQKYFPDRKKKTVKYSDEFLFERAKEFDHIREFREAYPNLYYLIHQRGLSSIAFKHMERLVNPRVDGYQVYAYEFADSHAYVGVTGIERNVRRSVHAWTGPVHVHHKKTGLKPRFKILRESVPPAEMPEQEQFWQDYYVENGWTPLWKAKAGSAGSVGTIFDSNRVVYTVIGVSGSGKSWVCESLSDVFYVKYDHDKRTVGLRTRFLEASRQPLPIVFDPFSQVSATIRRFPGLKFKVYGIVEELNVIKSRIEGRGGEFNEDSAEKYTARVRSIVGRFQGFQGTSQEVLDRVQRDMSST